MSKRNATKKTNDVKKTPPKKTNIVPQTIAFRKSAPSADGFANFVSRLGIGPGVDNQLSAGFYEFNLLTRNRIQLEAMYRGSWVVGAMIDSVAEDMTRAGVTITSNEAAQDMEELQAGMVRLGIMNSLCDTIKWARLYGGSIGVFMVDGQDLSSPLDISRVGKGQFTGINVYDRWQLQPDLIQVIRSGPEIGLPAYYTIVTSQSMLEGSGTAQETIALSAQASIEGGLRVHHSRVVRMIGVQLPFFQAITEMMWGMSEIERLNDRLVSFDTSTLSAANLINHAHLRTVKIDGLREIVSAGGKALEGLMAQFEMMRVAQSNDGLTLLDKLDEFDSTSYTFSGLSDMMLQFAQQLSGASKIPLVRLLGQSPAGLNSTGESDIRNYYDSIKSQQESRLRPGMSKIIKLTFQSMFGRPAPSDLQFDFTPLWQMSALDQANIGRTKTETIVGAYDSALIDKATTLKELRQTGSETGLFQNITDEQIAEAEKEVTLPPPPLPGMGNEVDKEAGNISGSETHGGVSSDPTKSLNGAQVTAMLSIINQVSAGQIPRETAVNMMTTAFPIDATQASAILGKVGKGFVPETSTEVKV